MLVEKLMFTNEDNIKKEPDCDSGEALLDKYIPAGWARMDDEYELVEEDEKNGLKDFLYGARNVAANAVSNLFSELGIDSEQFKYLYKIPIGLEEKSDMAGIYEPGCYGIVIGRNSKEIEEFSDGKTNKEKLQKRLASSITHEMIHSFQTVLLPDDKYGTVGDAVMGWKEGLEEGMAEALGSIAMKMSIKGCGLIETAQDLEDYCAENDMPATQMSARLIRKMKPEQLRWYLTCGKTGEAKSNNQIKKMFNASYDNFCRNMVSLYDDECKGNLPNNVKNLMVYQTIQFIDTAMSSQK